MVQLVDITSVYLNFLQVCTYPSLMVINAIDVFTHYIIVTTIASTHFCDFGSKQVVETVKGRHTIMYRAIQVWEYSIRNIQD